MRPDRVSGRAGLLLRAALAAALGWALPAWAPAPAAGADSLTVSFTPRDEWPPSPVTDLTALPGAEGQLLLQWTAPDSNGYALAGLSAASTYYIRVATFSVASVGGSTTTWWALAADVQALAPPAIGAVPPAPGAPGSLETLLLSQLEPGVTYWAMMHSRDAAGLESDADTPATSGSPANALVYDAAPPAPAGLAAAQSGRSTFTVTFGTVNAYDLDFYRLYYSTSADFAGYWYVDVDTQAAATVSTQVVVSQSSGVYYFRVSAWDKGAPGYPGLPLESPYSATASAELIPRLPQAPYGVALSTGAGSVSLRWLPVVRFADGTGFTDPQAPTPDELTGYRVYGALSPLATYYMYESAPVGVGTQTWTGPSTATWSYYVRAENATGLSRASIIRSLESRSAWVVTPETTSYVKSFFEVRAPALLPVEGVPGDPQSAYLIEASSRPEDLGGRVVQSLFFGAWKGGVQLDPYLAIPGLGRLNVYYNVGAGGQVTTPAGAAPLAGVPSTPANLAVYWYNGSKWVQLYGKVDETAQMMSIETKYFGGYQLRTVERAQGFNFDQAGVSNRMVTPNGDGKNDAVVFTYDNPRDSQVRVRLLDVRGREVVGDLPQGPVSNSKVWDGTAGGRAVPGGVYIYQIESEGRVYTGTIVIIR